jgi:hypothetical protein
MSEYHSLSQGVRFVSANSQASLNLVDPVVSLLRHGMGGTGKLVCPWGLGWAEPIEAAPSNEFGGATPKECSPVLNRGQFSFMV